MLCAHGGFNFDFKVLLNNMKKYDISLRELRMAQLHFADTFEFCKEVSYKTLIKALYFLSSLEIILSMYVDWRLFVIPF